ncbi:5'-3' exonuclease [Nocardioides litoris]|uniref:5'-3' exonuclease n=1 Tax=Nocardioides litoris TaxID=1926648 RepID=UPI001122C594|nr:5'-3' exonuclease H3TH domain-containing protein [Nocardioides litoris]
MDRVVLVVDAPGLLHRNHHARAGSDLRDQGGRPAWALHGMLRQVVEAIDRFAPDRVVFGFDDRTASRRAEAYPAYKAGRREKDETLVEQLDRAAPMLSAAGLHCVTPAGLEADDVTASAAAWASRQGWQCVVVTSDRDSFAHISAATRVLRLIDGGIHGSPLLDPRKLRTMYGIDAAQYLDYAALRGDASDNLPGVSGVGEKSAALLLEAAGSMDAVWADLEHADGATVAAAVDSLSLEAGGRRVGAGLVRKLAAPEARDQFDLNRRMMTAETDLDLALDPAAPGGPGTAGGLPVDAARVAHVVGHLGRPDTTELAVRVLATPADPS